MVKKSRGLRAKALGVKVPAFGRLEPASIYPFPKALNLHPPEAKPPNLVRALGLRV